MTSKIILILGLTAFFISRPCLSAEEKKDSLTPKPLAAPLEIWGKLQEDRLDTQTFSAEYLEKMAVQFDKINNPLCAAAVTGNLQEIDYLLRDGASPDSTDSLGISAISHAILGSSKPAVSKLLSAGANINQAGPFGVTPLMLAANSGMDEMVRFLLLNGADPKLKNDDGETALDIALRKDHHDVIVLLTPQPKPAAPEEKAVTAEAKPDPREMGPEPADPFPLPPAEMTAEPEAEVIEERAPPKDRPEPKKSKPLKGVDRELLQAVKAGLGQLTESALKDGANPDIRIENGISPLVMAVSQNDLNCAGILLRHKANPNIRTEFEMTPLMLAIQNKQPAMIRLLLRHGADPRKENIADQSSCDLGLSSPDEEIRELFKKCLPY